MGSESATEDIHEESAGILEEAKTTQLPSASPLSRSSSCGAPDKDENNNSIPKSKSEGDLSHEQGAASTPPQTPQWSMISASPVEGVYVYSSPPPVQIMESPSSFDPDRIPDSVFTSKPGNGSEWSMASNDSLFSIHMGPGTNSFKSGELPILKNDEWNTSSSPSPYGTEVKSHELFSLPPLMEEPANEESSAKSSNVSSYEQDDDHPVSTTPRPRHSNESGQSCTSFAFPVLESDGKAKSFERVDEEKPEQQTQQESNADADAIQDSQRGGWFSCLSCCPRCC